MELTPDIIEECCRTLLPGYNAWAHDGSFFFDPMQALRACEFFQEVLTFTTDRWISQPFVLQPWQCGIIGSVHGWRRQSDGLRRYRRALITTARKSGKTPIAAGLGLYHLFADGEANPSI